MLKKSAILSLILLTGIISGGCAVAAVGAVGAVAATGTAVGTDPRGAGQVYDDSKIQSGLASKYGNSKDFPDSNIYVDVYNQKVLLTGQVKNQDQKNFANRVAMGHPGVTKIYDYLAIRLPSSYSARSRDSLITTQLKTELLGAPGVSSNNIKVETTEGVVYLMGRVSLNEAESVTKIAAHVGGVSKVVTLFDYIKNEHK